MGSQENATGELERREPVDPGDRGRDEDVRQGLRDFFSSRRGEGTDDGASEKSRDPEHLHPADYIAPSADHREQLRRQVELTGPHDVRHYLDKINPRFAHGQEWTQNCGSSARAFAITYQSPEVQVASGRKSRNGEITKVMHQWTEVKPESLHWNRPIESSDQFTQKAWDRFEARAKALPDDTVVIVGMDWVRPDGSPGGGHWFNAVKKEGQLYWMDAQDGRSGRWPPKFAQDIHTIDATYRTAADRPWKELKLVD